MVKKWSYEWGNLTLLESRKHLPTAMFWDLYRFLAVPVNRTRTFLLKTTLNSDWSGGWTCVRRQTANARCTETARRGDRQQCAPLWLRHAAAPLTLKLFMVLLVLRRPTSSSTIREPCPSSSSRTADNGHEIL